MRERGAISASKALTGSVASFHNRKPSAHIPSICFRSAFVLPLLVNERFNRPPDQSFASLRRKFEHILHGNVPVPAAARSFIRAMGRYFREAYAG
jgi:hypothetical protein